MLTDLDFHAPSARLVVRRVDHDWLPSLVLHDLAASTVITEIDPSCVPQGPRLSHDGQRLAYFGNGRIFVHDMVAAEASCVFDHSDLHASFCEWSPDDQHLAFSAYSTHDTTNPGPDIYCFNVTDGGLIQLTNDSTCYRFPQWSPDGSRIVFQRDDPADRTWGSHIGLVDISTRDVSLISSPPGASSRVGRFCWSSDGAHLLIMESGAAARLRVVSVVTNEDVWEFAGEQLVSGAFVPDRTILAVRRNELVRLAFPSTAIVERLSLSEYGPVRDTLPQPALNFDERGQTVLFLTQHGSIYEWTGTKCVVVLEEPAEPLPEFQEHTYVMTSRDGRQTTVRRFTPPHPKPEAVMFVHGGPPQVGDATTAGPEHFIAQRLLKAGYEIVCPAYRGMSENEGEYGQADMWDVLDAATDWKQRVGQERALALIGYSYGGYLVSLALVQPAAPWNCGVSLWGATRPFGLHAARWYPSDSQAREAARRERDPMAQASHIRVPLLILAGGRDPSSPQADLACIQERMESQGLVCELIVYPNDTHGLPLHRQEVYERVLDFLARFG